MNLHFFIIVLGLLGGYAVFRTTRRGWIRFLVVVVFLAGGIQVAFDALFPHVPGGYVASAQGQGQGGNDYFADKLAQLENNRCMMSHLRDSPLSSFAYLLELHRFLSEYKRLQTPAHAQENTLANFSRMFDDSFTDDDVVPGKSTVAVAAASGSLCEKFTRWMGAEAQAHNPLPHVATAPAIPAMPVPTAAPAAQQDAPNVR